MTEESELDRKAASKREHIHWPSVLVTAFLTLVVSVITAMIVFFWQSRDPNLSFTAGETIPFSGENRVVGIYQVTFGNDGKRVAEDVICVVRIPGGTIEQKRLSAPPTLIFSETVIGDSLRLQTSALNPREEVTVSILATSVALLPSRPEVSLRARGVLGSPKTQVTERESFLRIVLPIAIAVTLAGSVFTVFANRAREHFGSKSEANLARARKEAERLIDLHVEADQRQVLAYLCRTLGLSAEADRYAAMTQETSYWAEADRLSQAAALSDDAVFRGRVKDVLKALLNYAEIAKQSEAIVLYNIARICAVERKLDEAATHMAKARDLRPNLINKREQIDPILRSVNWSPGAHEADG